MAEHVDEGARRGEEPMTIQPMVSTTPPGKKLVMIFVLMKQCYE
jgi:hypothetical protein